MSSLLVLDHAVVAKGPDPYRVVHDHPWSMQVFDSLAYTRELDKALEAVRRRRDIVVVIGPTFLNAYAEGQKALCALFAEAGLPVDRLVIIHCPDPRLRMACEYKGKFFHNTIPEVVFLAAGFRPNSVMLVSS